MSRARGHLIDVPRRVSAIVLLLLLTACGDDFRPTPDGGIIVYRDLGPPRDFGGWDAGVDLGPDAAADAGTDDAFVGPGCGAEAACNARLRSDGTCPGECVALDHHTSCAGTVEGGLCYGDGAPPPRVARSRLPPNLEAVVIGLPDDARVGDELVLTVRFENTGTRALSIPMATTAGETFTLLETDAPAALSLDPGATRTVTSRVRAERFNASAPTFWTALRFDFGGGERAGLFLRVPTYENGGRLCGEHFFPASSVGFGDADYVTYACCDDVFFPGSECCDDRQCGDAACVDGTCVRRLAVTRYGASPLGAPVHVLLVMADRPDLPSDDPCADRSAELAAELRLDAVADWFRDRVTARTGLPAPPWRFTVLTGFDSDAIGADVTNMQSYAATMEAHLADLGCVDSFHADFDRVAFHTPRFTTDHGGLAFDVDRVGLRAYSASLFAHELGHSFGATDLYLDARGGHLNDGALMSSSGGPDPSVFRDDVLRAETGLDDLDHDGVIDMVGYSHAPESLALFALEVTNVGAGAIELVFRVTGVESGVHYPIVPRAVSVALPDEGVQVPVDLVQARSFDDDGTLLRVRIIGLDPVAVATGETVQVRIQGRADYSTADFERVHRTLDVTVPVAIESAFGASVVDPTPGPPA